MLGRYKVNASTISVTDRPAAQPQVTLEVVISDGYPTSAGAQQLESHIMGHDVLEEVPPLHLLATPVPTALHHPLAPSRRVLGRFAGLGKVRDDVAFPALDGVRCVIEGHLNGATATPKTPHPPHGGEDWFRLRD